MAYMVTVNPTIGVQVAFEVGSLAEAVSVLKSEENAITTLMGIKIGDAQQPATAPEPAQSTKPGRKPRESKNQPDPATATAPPPAPVPSSDPMDTTIPPMLRRTESAPPPLVGAPPPPLAPAFVLGNKIADNLQARVDGSADKGAGLHAWLLPHVNGLTAPGASLAELIDVMRFTPDDKVRHLAQPLGVA